jgi:tetratricopeptide (TPR) repeat protein
MEAHTAFSMARVFDPDSPYIPMAIGEVALVGGDTEAAGAAWQEATRVDPGCAQAWMYRARIERLGGRTINAAGHYGRARELGHGWQAWAGEIDAWLHAKQRAEAAAVISEWTGLEGLSPTAAAERGQRRLRMGDPEGAAADLYPAAEARAEDQGAVSRWVAAVLLLEDRSAAMVQLDALAARAPGATAPLWASAVLGDAEGDSVRVRAALKAWSDLDPEDEALHRLRVALGTGGDQ